MRLSTGIGGKPTIANARSANTAGTARYEPTHIAMNASRAYRSLYTIHLHRSRVSVAKRAPATTTRKGRRHPTGCAAALVCLEGPRVSASHPYTGKTVDDDGSYGDQLVVLSVRVRMSKVPVDFGFSNELLELVENLNHPGSVLTAKLYDLWTGLSSHLYDLLLASPKKHRRCFFVRDYAIN